MKSGLIAILVALVFSTPAAAAVSGYYDSVEKIGTILGSAQLANILHQAPIGMISNTGARKDGAQEWLVRTQECDLTVYLVPVLPDGPGKTTYSLEIPGTCD
ncbi:hypothetical protein J5J10_13185 [Ciceribacter sp. L1K23]|uniref:hypothetical protein n=1 Tax=unclassified Ciceribacter TaxID=2628820 RepID=UPI001ABEBDE9|nr:MULTISPECIES: hypothetical protein [unclassified Ciceribacter]MBO3759218.1 hypothetical protein [Ciceribacter sp. L1K22]MBR0556634.1 hypothetical protein [Ciceribacter sp. L1K23]